jgi:CRISPR-associated protein Cas5t
MKALKICLSQQNVNYQKENMFSQVQSYNLPTPSTVKGAMHSCLELEEYHNLKIGIQGRVTSKHISMNQVLKFVDSRQGDRSVYTGKDGGTRKGLTMAQRWEDSIHVDLILHILFDEEGIQNKLQEAVLYNLTHLGRNNDLISIEKCEYVDLDKYSGRSNKAKNDMYVLREENSNVLGIDYDLPFYYVENGLKGRERMQARRKFIKIPVTYVKKGTLIDLNNHTILTDGGDIVSLLGVEIN